MSEGRSEAEVGHSRVVETCARLNGGRKSVTPKAGVAAIKDNEAIRSREFSDRASQHGRMNRFGCAIAKIREHREIMLKILS